MLALGTSFDTLGEAYDFSNLYSWEKGFGIRYRKSIPNVERTKCMQEIVCGCAGKAGVENSRSCRDCPALISYIENSMAFSHGGARTKTVPFCNFISIGNANTKGVTTLIKQLWFGYK